MVPAIPGVAVIVVEAPAQITELLTVTVGNGLTVTVPEALTLAQLVNGSVRITLYVPPMIVEKLETLPGAVAPLGTVQA